MVCHYCGYEIPMPKTCPACGSRYISGFKAGTQKIEMIVKERFPQARVLRMDMDTTRNKEGYEQILSAFANQEADILIGTQMIVKGHDFPKVTLVGILAAEGKRITAESLSLVLGDPVVLARSQTYAFTVLGLSQLFHAVGMRDVGRSVFRMNHLENRLMLAAAALGVLLQVLVTENSRLVALFQTAALSGTEWRELLFLAAAPLAAHELLAGLSRISGARGTAEKERSGS